MNRIVASLLSPDDPRLTAFALGELEAEEQAAIAAAVADHPELRHTVDEIRRAAEELTAALASEPLPSVAPMPRLAGLNGYGRSSTLVAFPAPQSRSTAISDSPRPAAAQDGYMARTAAGRRRREPKLSYFWVMTLSAACFMLIVFLGERRFSAQEAAASEREARIAATERARAAAATARRPYLELDLSRAGYARADFGSQRTARDAERREQTYLPADDRPTSSFPIDVATTSYGDVVRAIAARQVPPAGSVRIEEMLNTFAYDYPDPAADDEAPFAGALEAADAPWAPGHRLVRIGLKGRTDRGVTIARNVSIQVQFNPETVRAYRLIGYEKSPLVAQETLSAGRVDVAEVRAGHTVTALYEVIPVAPVAEPPADLTAPAASLDPMRLLTVRIAYTRPDGVAARPLEFPLDDRGSSFGDASGDFKFAAAVAGFGMMLRQPGGNGTLTCGTILSWAEQGAAHDRTGRRQEFVGLVREASEFLQ